MLKGERGCFGCQCMDEFMTWKEKKEKWSEVLIGDVLDERNFVAV